MDSITGLSSILGITGIPRIMRRPFMWRHEALTSDVDSIDNMVKILNKLKELQKKHGDSGVNLSIPSITNLKSFLDTKTRDIFLLKSTPLKDVQAVFAMMENMRRIISSLRMKLERLEWEKRAAETEKEFLARIEKDFARVLKEAEEEVKRLEEINREYYMSFIAQIQDAIKELQNYLEKLNEQIRAKEAEISQLEKKLDEIYNAIEESLNAIGQDIDNTADEHHQILVRYIPLKQKPTPTPKLEQKAGETREAFVARRKQAADKALKDSLEPMSEQYKKVITDKQAELAKDTKQVSDHKHELEEQRTKLKDVDAKIAAGEDKDGSLRRTRDELANKISDQEKITKDLAAKIKEGNDELARLKENEQKLGKTLHKLEKDLKEVDEKSAAGIEIKQQLEKAQTEMVGLKSAQAKTRADIKQQKALAMEAEQQQSTAKTSDTEQSKVDTQAKPSQANPQETPAPVASRPAPSTKPEEDEHKPPPMRPSPPHR